MMCDHYSEDSAVIATEKAADRAHEILCDAEQLHDVLLDNLPAVAEALAGCFLVGGRSHVDTYVITGALNHLQNQLHKSIVEDIYEKLEADEHRELNGVGSLG
jgi:phage gp29-like protein